MLGIIHALFALLCIGVILAFVLIVMWFCYALFITFFKVYGKRLKEVNNCNHKNYHYSDLDPEKPWSCNNCGENIK